MTGWPDSAGAEFQLNLTTGPFFRSGYGSGRLSSSSLVEWVAFFPESYNQRQSNRHYQIEESDDIIRFEEAERAGCVEPAQLGDVLHTQN